MTMRMRWGRGQVFGVAGGRRLVGVVVSVVSGLVVARWAVLAPPAVVSSGAGSLSVSAGVSIAEPLPGPPGTIGPSISIPVRPGVYNAVDVDFVTAMIPHAHQAVLLAGLAPSRGAQNEVKNLAAVDAGEQEPEASALEQVLAVWCAEGLTLADRDVRRGPLAPADAVDELRRAKGSTFDHVYMNVMIQHHGDAVRLARAEQRDGDSPPVKLIAAAIVEQQVREIDRLQQLAGNTAAPAGETDDSIDRINEGIDPAPPVTSPSTFATDASPVL
jgi:uncharacterized protein (DUF305 family)